ncbi:hypothetical protein SeMB42_g07085 [Synchytrium endobioticum]|uniref:Derlin n=1 Tax=Synchytrium endobioticum TaxID=286115 RepID=A0A507CI46_9FUNG|nr:hypothetical protein SeMB42_g07085 [Synchytrium endobioticum]TPX39039.1 hypothetical protein SeLEV6574_g07449 [Synchytrium endobioticum]
MPHGPFEDYMEIPLVTRVYITAVCLTSLACQLNLVSAFHLHFNWDLIWRGRQYWRLMTSFLYFGNFSLDFLFHLFFLVRYSRALEEGSFRNRTADYFWMLFLGAISIIIITPWTTARSAIPFLSSPLTFFLVYVWSRRNTAITMSFLGLFTFTAPYLPWVLLGFTVLMHNVWPSGDLIGMAVGHLYYFLEDVYPRMEGRENHRPLATPELVKRLFDDVLRDRDDAHLPPMAGGDGGRNHDAVGNEPRNDAGPM